MIEKTEWEVVDDGRQRAQRRFEGGEAQDAGFASGQEAGFTAGRDPRRAAQAASAAMLGPWWKWKLAGVAALALVVFAIVATMIGVVAVSLVALAILGAGVRKLLQWTRGEKSTSIMRL